MTKERKRDRNGRGYRRRQRNDSKRSESQTKRDRATQQIGTGQVSRKALQKNSRETQQDE